MPATTQTVFASEAAFHTDRPERLLSGEADYGVMWTHGNARWPQWRVSYIQATGEVYAICLAGTPRGTVRLLGYVPADPVGTPRRASESYYRTLDQILDGWGDRGRSGFRLSWVKRKLDAAAAAHPEWAQAGAR